jgi:transmembrane E3 ubiquitin-protein ligase
VYLIVGWPPVAAVMDSYICLLHVVAGIMWETLFNSFATISFSELMLFSILEMRLMLHIWKARRAEAFANGWNETRRQLGILYARFYGALIVGMFLMYQFWVRRFLTVVVVVGLA